MGDDRTKKSAVIGDHSIDLSVSITDGDFGASGQWSFCTGVENLSSGIASCCMGGSNSATGNRAAASGSFCTASGIDSWAGGSLTKASGQGAFSVGYQTEAIGGYSFSAGTRCAAGGDYSLAFGIGNRSEGQYSFCGGGRDNVASGTASAAFGENCLASGASSFCSGGQCVASGDESTAEGAYTTASGLFSHAEGNVTIAAITASHAEGDHTITGSVAPAGVHVGGAYNVAPIVGEIESIGIGSVGIRKTGRSLFTDGTETYPDSTPAKIVARGEKASITLETADIRYQSKLPGLVPAADRVHYWTSATTGAMAPATTFGRSLWGVVDAPAGRTALGLDGVYVNNPSARNLLASINVGYNSAYAGYQRTFAKKLIRGDSNIIGLCGKASTDPLAIIKTSAVYSLSFWYKVENFVSPGVLTPGVNNITLGISITANAGWTRYTGSVLVTANVGTSGNILLSFPLAIDADIYVSDIVVTRSNVPASEWYPAPEDFTCQASTASSTGTISSFSGLEELTGAGDITRTLPPANSRGAGNCYRLIVKNLKSAGVATLSRGGTDYLYGFGGTENITSVGLSSGQSITVESNGVDKWFII